MARQVKQPAPQPPRRGRNVQERRRDVEKSPGKLPEPTVCAQCGAVFHKGRWTWEKRPAKAKETLCPACRRVNDNLPAGYLTIQGAYGRDHRMEILQLARNEEAKEKAEHPLARIIAVEEQNGALVISTTDPHLARRIGEAIHRAHQGDFTMHYSKDEQFLRAIWEREA